MRIIGECCFAFYISYHCQIQLDRHFTQLEEEQHNTRSHVRKTCAVLWLLSILAQALMLRLPKRYQLEGPLKLKKQKMRQIKRVRIFFLLWTWINRLNFTTFDCQITFPQLTSHTHFLPVYWKKWCGKKNDAARQEVL